MTWYQKNGSKYGAKKTVTGGRQYDSKKEAGYSQQLELLLKARQVEAVIPQKTLQLFAYGRKICRYRMDFEVIKKGKVIELHEVKGFATDTWRMKWSLLEANLDQKDFREYNGYPMDVELIMVLVK